MQHLLNIVGGGRMIIYKTQRIFTLTMKWIFISYEIHEESGLGHNLELLITLYELRLA